MLKVGISLILGLLAGIVMAATAFPNGATTAEIVAVAGTVGTLWVDALRMTVVPLVVPLLVVGVAARGEIRRVGRLGLRAFVLFVVILSIIAVVTVIVTPGLFRFLPLDPESTAALRAGAHVTLPSADDLSFRTWLVSLIPVNPVKAAADGAFLPVIIFALIYGFALSTVADEARARQVAMFRSIGDVMLVVVRGVLWLAPLGVFGLALVLGTQLGASAIGAIGYFLALLLALLLVLAAALYLTVALAGHVPVGRFARAVIPAQAVAFSSRSSLASLPALIEAAREELRLPAEVTGFVLPLSVSVFKFTAPMHWTLGALFVGHLYGIHLGPAQLATLAAGSVALNFSTPGIPSGGLLIQAPLFAAVGLPVEGLGILIAIDTIPDMFKTALNVTADLAVATILGRPEAETPAAS